MKNVTFIAALLLARRNPGHYFAVIEADRWARLLCERCGDDPEAMLSINIYDPRGVLAGEEGTE